LANTSVARAKKGAHQVLDKASEMSSSVADGIRDRIPTGSGKSGKKD
jgi:hypothetical protein